MWGAVSFRVFRRTFNELFAKGLLEKYADGTVKLKGIAEIHAGVVFRDGDNSVPERGPDGDDSGTERPQTTDNRGLLSNKDNPQTPFSGKITHLPVSLSENAMSLFEYSKIKKLCSCLGIASALDLQDLTCEAYEKLDCEPNWIEFVAKLYDIDRAKNRKTLKHPKRVAVTDIAKNNAPKRSSVDTVLRWIYDERAERHRRKAGAQAENQPGSTHGARSIQIERLALLGEERHPNGV